MEAVTNSGQLGPGTANIRACSRCGLRYDWRRSPSALKMTYCGSLCERGDLGFTLDGLIASLAELRRSRPLPLLDLEPALAAA